MPVDNLLPLADGDILAVELASIGQFYKEDDDGNRTDELVILPFEHVREHLDTRVEEIKDALNTRFEPIMFLTGEGNFRETIAKRKGYKANRTQEKPYHFKNTYEYIKSRYNTVVSRGCEADDLMCIWQTKRLKECGFNPEMAETVIVTRDKDLRQCMGWHYGWEVGKQAEYKLRWIDELGSLTPHYKEGITKTGRPSRRFDKLTGEGLKWLYAQVLTGDVVDNIPGCPRIGPKAAYDILDSATSETELLDSVVAAYKDAYEDSWETEFFEQMHLVYMLRELGPNNELIYWSYPDGYTVS